LTFKSFESSAAFKIINLSNGKCVHFGDSPESVDPLLPFPSIDRLQLEDFARG
jgi:hypothetical protein